MREKKQIEVIDMHGAKTVEKKTSYITRIKRIFAIVSVIWLLFIICFPLYVKNTYSGSIKKSIVVSMFYDLQHNISKQYERLLQGIKKSINLEKPVKVALKQVKMAERTVDKVTDTTVKAKNTTNDVKNISNSVSKLSGIVKKIGINTDSVDKVVDSANSGINKADATINQVDSVAKLVNEKLSQAETNLVKLSQTEVDKIIDEAIKTQLDKTSGGLATTLLTNYGIRHVYPWRPSSWPIAVKIYNDLEKSDVGIVNVLTDTVNKYFGYVAWGLVVAAWLLGVFIWVMMFKKVKSLIAPFLVCPRCGHTYADKRTAYGLLKALQPWKWL